MIKSFIDSIIKGAVAPILRAAAYRGSGRNFHKASADLVRLINIQASNSNSGSVGKFTVNLGLFFPSLNAIIGPPIKAKLPTEPECDVRMRIGFLMPVNADHWWTFDTGEDPSKLLSELSIALSVYALPWIEKSWTLVNVIEDSTINLRPHQIAALAYLNGDPQKTQQLLQELYDNKPASRAFTGSIARKMSINIKKG